MATSTTQASDPAAPPAWGARPPSRDDLHVEWVADIQHPQGPVIGMVRHPAHPFERELAADPNVSRDDWLIGVAGQYLSALAGLFEDGELMTPAVLDVLGQGVGKPATSHFGWLPIAGQEPGDAAAQPDSSFWVDSGDGQGQAAQRTLVLLAGRHWGGRCLGGDVGLRVAVHVCGQRVRITGVTLSGLADAAATQVPFGDPTADARAVDAALNRLKQSVQDSLRLHGVYLTDLFEQTSDQSPPIQCKGIGWRWRSAAHQARSGRAKVYQFIVDLDPQQQVLRVVERKDMNSQATGKAQAAAAKRSGSIQAFAPDGSMPKTSIPPWRSEAKLLALLQSTVPVPTPSARGRSPGGNQTEEPQTPASGEGAQIDATAPKPRLFEVRAPQSPRAAATVVADPRGVIQPTTLATQPAIRSDQFAAGQAHVQAEQFFARMQGFGLDPARYFRFASLPLVLRARAATTGAPDGDTLFAEVRPFISDNRAVHRRSIQLLVKFGSVAPEQRRLVPLPNEPHRRRAQYLGVAADPRWAWHEFGHVLNYASTGELELPFAHSAGDALAAISGDPALIWSNDDPQRFATYPWIAIPNRRHGRRADTGYCWCGARNLLRLASTAPRLRHRHGYFEEQLLSSSLFRLYRCMGGDTRGDTRGGAKKVDLGTRQDASNYGLFLIMRAIALLGSDSVAPARTPDQFVSALIEADVGTGRWSRPAGRKRAGGQLHKVIRWAFEQQGLYADGGHPQRVVDGAGKAPPVDLYIADQRRGSDVPDGGYWPMPLRANQANAPWHAHSTAISRVGKGIAIEVHNRGSAPASGVSVAVWASPGLGQGAVWTAVPVPNQVPSLGHRDKATVTTADLDDPFWIGERWVLAVVDSSGDPAIAPPGLALPTDRQDLLDWVASDNNVALRQLSP